MLMFISLAYAAGDQASSPFGALWSFLPIILIFPIFYFLVIMPQQKARKKHKSMIEDLKKGDKVVSNSGIIGTIVSVDKDTILLQVATDVKLRMLKSAITDLRKEE